MKLSAPVYVLKRKAKLLSRRENIPLHEALGRVARQEGYSSWSLLAAKLSASTPAVRLVPLMECGDLVLVGARPGEGKTLMSLELAVEVMKAGNRAVFFTLEYTAQDVLDCFHAIGADYAQYEALLEVDCSDAISAPYIIKALASAPRGTLVVIDYLQLLDQKRENPELAEQVRALKAFAADRGLIIVFISQIDRSYDPSLKPFPDIHDIRLPNPLDVQLFSRACFLNGGEVRFHNVKQDPVAPGLSA